MSGIYIKGMEMPKSCSDCFAERCIGSDFGCDILDFDDANTTCFTRERRKDCPLVAVPDHGRLIDADALENNLKQQCSEVFKLGSVSPEDYYVTRREAYMQATWRAWCEGFYEYLNTRPTIIPADKGGE